MAITGVHGLFYTSEPDALRATLRDVFGWPSVEAHPGGVDVLLYEPRHPTAI